MVSEIDGFRTSFTALVAGVSKVVRGQSSSVELATTCLLAEGHLLIEDVSGVGKTMLAKTLAAALGLPNLRIQCTPDLLPSDITGVTMYNRETNRFQFMPGPVFTNVLIVDELNRASPRTQSALLEVMEEKQVTVDGTALPLDLPFMLIATQNPVDREGTQSLPEAQLDRFMMKIPMGYPNHETEVDILRSRTAARERVDRPSDPFSRHTRAPQPTVDLRDANPTVDFVEMTRLVDTVLVSDDLYGYVVRLVAATRGLPQLERGASPRAGIALVRAAQVRAAASGRTHVTPDDVSDLARPVLAHRLVPSFAFDTAVVPEDVVGAVLATVRPPLSARHHSFA